MKKLLITALISFLVLGAASNAMAITLTSLGIGGEVYPTGITTDPTGYGTLLASTSQAFSAPGYFTGTLNQWVYSNSDGLLFAYELTNNLGSSSSLSRLSANNFAGFTTSVDWYRPDLSTKPYPKYVDRSDVTDQGRTVGFQFSAVSPYSKVTPTSTSSLLLIQTNAPSYQWSTTAVQNGTNINVPTYGPAPEPSSMLLLGMGILGLFGLGRKKKA